MQTIPRAIWLHKSGRQLVQWPVEEVEKLRAYPVNLPPQVLKGGQLLHINGVTATQVSFTCYNLVKILIIIKVLNYVQDDACNNFKKIIYTIMLKE